MARQPRRSNASAFSPLWDGYVGWLDDPEAIAAQPLAYRLGLVKHRSKLGMPEHQQHRLRSNLALALAIADRPCATRPAA